MTKLIRLGALAAALALAACNTPSIPIPPPEPGAMTFAVDEEAGTATYEYDRDEFYSFAIVYVYNEDTGVGVIDTARADGSVGPTAPFRAAVGDRITVTHQVDDQLLSACVILADGRLNANARCP